MPNPLDRNKKVLIFSDLDATLLDHYDYSFAPVVGTLSTLKSADVPVILNTSKTAAEVKVIHQQLGLSTPFIVENGAAIYLPKNTFKTKPKDSVWQDGYWVKTFASRRAHWIGLIKKLTPKFGNQFEMFSQMSVARISQVTGLSEENALLASNRLFGEPLLWKGTNDQRAHFINEVKKLGAFTLLGGRFLHICGDTNKGKALTWLSNEYQRQWQVSHISTIALGDSNNDIAMLEVADIAIRILSPIHPPPTLQRSDNVHTSTLLGPEGWREVIEQIFPVQ